MLEDFQAFPDAENPGMSYREYLIAKIACGYAGSPAVFTPHLFARDVIAMADQILEVLDPGEQPTDKAV